MIQVVIAAFFAAFLMFMWGFVFWASGVIDPFTHLSPEGETAISDAIRAHTSVHGLYMVPDIANGTETEVAARAASGPYAMMYIKPTGAPIGDPVTMGLGFSHMFVTALLVGVLLRWCLPATPGWLDRFKIAALVGVIAAFFAQLGPNIWWHHDLGTSLVFGAYDLGAYLIAGAVMAWGVRTG